ncbi:ABC transporter substrate-binding protein [Planosporangium thailandense]|uniref:ABC transporter substrate-binding protein n=1 Tax=Planosporangium thailandense TaxID=765197 RepID=A0ABX0Y4H4_9ACTN|nr:ABC transporter substrate-binding protein [Planosporangium thailandense]NJC72308.1 ABC transporter substrate-binding protein [Planosporangium thailandense]
MRVAGASLAAGMLLLAAACSGGSGGSSGGGNASDQSAGARGPITYVQGKDNNNVIRPLIDQWNAAHPNEKVTFKEQSDQADQQHDDLVQHFQAKDPNYDVVDVDVVWTAEFAAKGWLQPLKDKFAIDTSKLLPATVKTGTYNGTLYAAPQASDGGLLYYRKDLVPNPPKTWDEMMSACSIAKSHGMDCYAGQFAKYEGLTVNASEAINTAGGQVVKSDGKTPDLDTDAARKGLGLLVDAYKNGNIPQQAITYQEEQGRQSFEAGKLLFLRNWPYMYSLASTDGSSVVKDKFGVAPLPGLTGPGASTLGGHNAAISAYSAHKATALDFVKFLESEETQRTFVEKASLAPVIASLYDDQALVSKLPYLPTLKTSIENAVPRPVTPFYPAVTKAIEENSYAAIKGDKSVDQALKDMQAAIQSAGS